MQFTRYLLVFVLFCSALHLSSARRHHSLQCIDDDHRPVDWYIALKWPKLLHVNRQLFSGRRYATLTSRAPNGWRLSTHQIDDYNNSILANTLRPLYGNKLAKYSFAFYNDQHGRMDGEQRGPRGSRKSNKRQLNDTSDYFSSLAFAHAKGILASDGRKAFWMMHSVPQFASSRKFHFPKSGLKYGQVVLCITMRPTELANIATHLLTIKPHLYELQIGSKPKRLVKALQKLANGEVDRSQPYRQLTWSSLAGQSFQSFFKSSHYSADLYSAIVAPTLNTSLAVETWRPSTGPSMGSLCNRSVNVEQVQVTFANVDGNVTFSYKSDHSKWAVGEAGGAAGGGGGHYVCVGDLNRMQSQLGRGGGATCLELYAPWKAFAGLVKTSERCTR